MRAVSWIKSSLGSKRALLWDESLDGGASGGLSTALRSGVFLRPIGPFLSSMSIIRIKKFASEKFFQKPAHVMEMPLWCQFRFRLVSPRLEGLQGKGTCENPHPHGSAHA